MRSVVPVVYVAGPFAAETTWRRAENIREAETLGLKVARAGAMPLIPHANTANFEGELTIDFWYAGTVELLLRCDAIALTPRWRVSSGAVSEYEKAKALGMPIFEDDGRAEHPGYAVSRLQKWLADEVLPRARLRIEAARMFAARE